MQLVTRLCFGVAAAIALSLNAQAADLRAPAPRAAGVNWTGWYVGATAGYGWSNSHVDPRGSTTFCNELGGNECAPGFFNLLPVGANSLPNAQAAAIPISLLTHPSGAMLGGHLGYDYQFGSWVAGLETDLSWTNFNGSSTQFGGAQVFPNSGGASPAINSQAIAEQRFRYFGTLRARLGYLPAESLLLFVTGGLAYAQASSSLTLTEGLTPGFGVCTGCGPITPAISSSTRTRVGGTVGFGAEFIIPQQKHWSFKAEYLYFNLGSAEQQSALLLADGTGALVTAVAVNTKVDFSGSIFRAGFNYRLD